MLTKSLIVVAAVGVAAITNAAAPVSSQVHSPPVNSSRCLSEQVARQERVVRFEATSAAYKYMLQYMEHVTAGCLGGASACSLDFARLLRQHARDTFGQLRELRDEIDAFDRRHPLCTHGFARVELPPCGPDAGTLCPAEPHRPEQAESETE